MRRRRARLKQIKKLDLSLFNLVATIFPIFESPNIYVFKLSLKNMIDGWN